MPDFVRPVVDRVSSHNLYGGPGKKFLDAFLGGRIEKEDETGRFAVNPLTGDVELESPGGFTVTANPVRREVEGRFQFGGADRNLIGRSPEQALDEALGISPVQAPESPVEDWQDLWLKRNPNYQ